MQLLPAFTTFARGDVCSICGWHQRAVDEANPNGPKEAVVDTGIFIDEEGSFEICETCVIELGGLVGMIEPGRAEGLEVENVALRKRAEEAERELAEAKDAFLTSIAKTARTAAAAKRG